MTYNFSVVSPAVIDGLTVSHRERSDYPTLKNLTTASGEFIVSSRESKKGGFMSIHYYLSVFPMEALIASELDPVQFGSYMATGDKKGSDELIIFAEVSEKCSKEFDWKYAEEKCVSHPDGDSKHSVYLSVYRTLEHIPLSAIGSIYLTTRDGRSLELKKGDAPAKTGKDYFVYQELCPIKPLIISRLDPNGFAAYMTDRENHVFLPKLMFADLQAPDFDDPENTGNTGGFLMNKKDHFMHCVQSVNGSKPKHNKTFDRSHVESFSFQTIGTGIYIGDGKEISFYPMPDIEEIKNRDYDWGRSALLY